MTSTNTYLNKKYCVYIINYAGNKLPSKNNATETPSNYIGSSTLDKIQKGYMGSVKSKNYKNIWKSELKNNPNLFSVQIISYHDTRPSAIYKELQIQKIFNVVKNPLFVNMSYAAPNGFFGRDVSLQNHPLYNIPRPEKTKEKISMHHADVSGKNNPRYGTKHKKITNGIKNMLISADCPIPENWWFGSTIWKKENKPRNKKPKMFCINNGIENNFLIVGTEIPIGWIIGKLPENKYFSLISTKNSYIKRIAFKLFPELFYSG
jgi:hypothetical protein